jgi:cytoskeletal protein CcmA (bactofilin family)
MNFPTRLTTLIALASTIFLSACMGGGEGGTGVTGNADISRGQITGFGSIFVNGVEFDTTDSTISLDGASGTESDLKLGMVVTVTGTINPDRLTGKADTVSVEEVIQGLVQANDNVNTLTVLKHTVELPSNVRFDGVADINGITAMADYVEVSGYVISDNVISATRVELLGSGSPESGIFGTVSNLSSGFTFTIGPLTVDYSLAELSGFSNNQITNGLYVEVEGTFNPGSGILTATSVERSRISEDDVDEMEIEGFVTNVDELPSKFILNDVPVLLDATTEFKGGSADEIVVGMFIEVDGSYINGALHAQEIVFDDTIRIKGEVASLGTDSITMAGMSGLTIRTDSLTNYGSALPGGFADLAQGTRIRIRGFQQDNTTVMARRIDTESSGDDASLQGKVTAEITPGITFAISGVAIDTSSIPDSGFIIEGEVKNSTEFFSSLDVGEDVVEAKGVLFGSEITWESVELE